MISTARRFQVQASIPVRGVTGQRLLIQVGRRGKTTCDYRIECNPALLGSGGMLRVRDVLDLILPNGGRNFLENGLVTRVDVALDLPGLSVNDVIVRSRRQRVHGIFSDHTGMPTTHYFGRTKNNHSAVYTKMTADAEPALRIERRIKPRCRGADLPLLDNPFTSLQVVRAASLYPYLHWTVPEYFLDSVRIRGFNHVLKKLPVRRRKELAACLNDPRLSLLSDIDEIWRCWPTVLLEIGLDSLTSGLLASNHPRDQHG